MIEITDNPTDIKWMNFTLDILNRNPDVNGTKSVAAIIIKNDKLISIGARITIVYDQIDTTFHAEQLAIKTCVEDLTDSTMYVTMEPCLKRGNNKYPLDSKISCCELILNSGINKVVINNFDEDFGFGGAEYLKSKNIKVFKTNI